MICDSSLSIIDLHDPTGDGGVTHAGAALADCACCRPKAAEMDKPQVLEICFWNILSN